MSLFDTINKAVSHAVEPHHTPTARRPKRRDVPVPHHQSIYTTVVQRATPRHTSAPHHPNRAIQTIEHGLAKAVLGLNAHPRQSGQTVGRNVAAARALKQQLQAAIRLHDVPLHLDTKHTGLRGALDSAVKYGTDPIRFALPAEYYAEKLLGRNESKDINTAANAISTHVATPVGRYLATHLDVGGGRGYKAAGLNPSARAIERLLGNAAADVVNIPGQTIATTQLAVQDPRGAVKGYVKSGGIPALIAAGESFAKGDTKAADRNFHQFAQRFAAHPVAVTLELAAFRGAGSLARGPVRAAELGARAMAKAGHPGAAAAADAFESMLRTSRTVDVGGTGLPVRQDLSRNLITKGRQERQISRTAKAAGMQRDQVLLPETAADRLTIRKRLPLDPRALSRDEVAAQQRTLAERAIARRGDLTYGSSSAVRQTQTGQLVETIAKSLGKGYKGKTAASLTRYFLEVPHAAEALRADPLTLRRAVTAYRDRIAENLPNLEGDRLATARANVEQLSAAIEDKGFWRDFAANPDKLIGNVGRLHDAAAQFEARGYQSQYLPHQAEKAAAVPALSELGVTRGEKLIPTEAGKALSEANRGVRDAAGTARRAGKTAQKAMRDEARALGEEKGLRRAGTSPEEAHPAVRKFKAAAKEHARQVARLDKLEREQAALEHIDGEHVAEWGKRLDVLPHDGEPTDAYAIRVADAAEKRHAELAVEVGKARHAAEVAADSMELHAKAHEASVAAAEIRHAQREHVNTQAAVRRAQQQARDATGFQKVNRTADAVAKRTEAAAVKDRVLEPQQRYEQLRQNGDAAQSTVRRRTAIADHHQAVEDLKTAMDKLQAERKQIREQNLKTKRKPYFVDSQGKEVSWPDAQRLLEQNGIDTGRLTWLSHNPRAEGRGAGGGQLPPGLGRARKTGWEQGVVDLSPERLVDDIMRLSSRDLMTEALVRWVERFGLTRRGEDGTAVTSFRGGKDAQKFADSLMHDPKTGERIPYVPDLVVVPVEQWWSGTGRAAKRAEAFKTDKAPAHETDSARPADVEEFGSQVFSEWQGEQTKTDAALAAGEDPQGAFIVMPKSARDQLFLHGQRKGTGITGMSQAMNAFRNTVLLTSSKWFLGNIAEMALRTAVAGAGPRALRAGKDLRRVAGEARAEAEAELAKMTPKELQAPENVARVADARRLIEDVRAFEAQTLSGAQMASALSTTKFLSRQRFYREHTLPHRMAGAFDKMGHGNFTLSKAWGVWREMVGGANSWFEQQGAMAAAGQLARRDFRELNRGMDGALRVGDKAWRDLIDRGELNTVNQEAYARHVFDVLGQYQSFSPGTRSFISTYAPFGAWVQNSLKFVFVTLPVDHPLLTGLAAAAYSAEADQEKALGLDLAHLTEKGLPVWLQGTLPNSDGSRTRWQHFLPFSIVTEGIPGLAGLLVPWAGWAAYLDGLDWAGNKLHNADGSLPGLPGRALFAANALAEGFIPFVRLARTIEERGGSSHNASTVFHPLVKGTPKTKGVKPTGSLLGGLDKGFNPVKPTKPGGASSGGVAGPSSADAKAIKSAQDAAGAAIPQSDLDAIKKAQGGG